MPSFFSLSIWNTSVAMAYTSVPSDPTPHHIQAARDHGIRLRQSAPIRKGTLPFELPIISHLKGKRVILASSSPRRKALLAQVGLKDLEIKASTLPEDLDKTAYTPYEYVSATARRKCMSVYEAALEEQAAQAKTSSTPPPDPELVIAADTVIVSNEGRVLEKPHSEAEHGRMLRHLRDTRVHRVLTAVVCLAPKADASHPGYEIAAHTEETKVYFAQEDDGLPDDVIDTYVKTREGADKAGGYAVQGIGGLVLVEKVEGCVDNVVGLPVRKTLALAEKVIFQQGEEEVQWSDEEGHDD
ncbi:Maf/Ham1 [Cryphonectria parasitica EP155]|uniref:Maf/Ham1 n=1 Tax=Cryphonectria parasitica (strain ATCC 38755 / EP155) TaxID=660469 RepID=A0A9P4Y195_CRYP1|nr:Maf/Ham1 [Cryphonectria parasitica EP155]KAF3764711.1 Maf/Ham1 [Cryphonectria parasitica EP155]